MDLKKLSFKNNGLISLSRKDHIEVEIDQEKKLYLFWWQIKSKNLKYFANDGLSTTQYFK